jgi:hypothetical protein
MLNFDGWISIIWPLEGWRRRAPAVRGTWLRRADARSEAEHSHMQESTLSVNMLKLALPLALLAYAVLPQIAGAV